MSIAAQIRRERQKRKWEQTELGRESGIPQGTLSRIERGLSAIDVEQLESLAGAFGMTLQELLDAADESAKAATPAVDEVYFPDGTLNPANTWTSRTSEEHAKELENDPDDD